MSRITSRAWQRAGRVSVAVWRGILWGLRALRWVLEVIAQVFVVLMQIIFFPLVIARFIYGPEAARQDDHKNATEPYWQHLDESR